MATFATLLASATKRLSAANLPDAPREARLLLQHAAGMDNTRLLLAENEPAPRSAATLYETFIARRLNREPVFRIIGKREFHGMDFLLNADTLEPRDDTETLVETVLARIDDRSAPLRFADLGTGTGIIALALLAELPNATATATDISENALVAAQNNAKSLGLAERFCVQQGPWLKPLVDRFDFIVSNPPYIPSPIVDELDPEVLHHDPRRALDGGKDGLDAYRAILRDAATHLSANGFLAIEIGYDQKEDVTRLAQHHGWQSIAAAQDLNGADRVLIFTPILAQQAGV
ncbi:MAG: peptide chain release factor N(5)-glutamine methyltransferase [Pseudomonadota bacterium]